jgi:NAD+ diphosphatase
VSPSHLPLGFATSALQRHSAEYPLEGDLAAGLAHPRARLLLFAGDAPVLAVAEQGASALLPPGEAARAGAQGPTLALGRVAGDPVFAAAAPKDAAAHYADDPAFRVLDLRGIAVEGAVPEAELGLLATAKSLLNWHGRHGFCANCGHATTLARGGFRRDCANCGTEHFPRTDPVVIMLVTRGDRCLLGRQARFLPGVYSCLAGFLEPGETIEDAVRREVREEAGITVGHVAYHTSQPWPFPSSLMIGCLGEALDEALTLDRDELEDGRWFSRDEVRQMLAREHPDGLGVPPPMAIAHHLVRHFAHGGDARPETRP